MNNMANNEVGRISISRVFFALYGDYRGMSALLRRRFFALWLDGSVPSLVYDDTGDV